MDFCRGRSKKMRVGSGKCRDASAVGADDVPQLKGLAGAQADLVPREVERTGVARAILIVAVSSKRR